MCLLLGANLRGLVNRHAGPLHSRASMKKTVAIVSKPQKAELHEIAPELGAWLRERGYRLLIDDVTAGYGISSPVVAREQIASEQPGFVIVLGGDGTMLAAARAVAQ